MIGQDNIISFSGGAARRATIMLDAKGQRIVAGCRQLLVTTIPKMMIELFEQLDDSLYELADKSDNNALQSS